MNLGPIPPEGMHWQFGPHPDGKRVILQVISTSYVTPEKALAIAANVNEAAEQARKMMENAKPG